MSLSRSQRRVFPILELQKMLASVKSKKFLFFFFTCKIELICYCKTKSNCWTKKKLDNGLNVYKCLKKVSAKFEVNCSSSFWDTVSTDFENTVFEKNAITGKRSVRKWENLKRCIFGCFDQIKLKLLETVLDIFYFD